MKAKRLIQQLVEAESTPTKYSWGIVWRNAQGKLHRIDGPAWERADGTKEWWVDGTKEWWVDGKRHRLDGPAVEWASGYKAWWVDGKQIPVDSQEEFVNYLLGIKI